MPSMHLHFSRWIGPLPERKTPAVGWLLLSAIVVGLLIVLVMRPIGTLAVLAAIALLTVMTERQRSTRVSAMLRDRPNEDIGSFARAFNRRGNEWLDAWA